MLQLIPQGLGAIGRYGFGLLARGGRGLLGGAKAVGRGVGFGAGFGLVNNPGLPSNQQVGASNMPGRGGIGMGRAAAGGGFSGGGVTAAQATSALQDGDGTNQVVNAIQDLKEVVVSIKGDTATIASGMFGQNKATQPPSENAIRGMFGGGGGLGAGAAAGLGIGTALGLNFLRGMEDADPDDQLEEKDLAELVEERFQKVKDFISDANKTVTENLESWADNLSTTISTLSRKIQPLKDTLVSAGKSALNAPGAIISKTGDMVKKTVDVVGTAARNMSTPTPSVSSAGSPSNVVDLFSRERIDTSALDNVEKLVIPEKTVADAGGSLASSKAIAKSIAKAAGSFGLKVLPVAGMGAGAYFTAERAGRGDINGAILEGIGILVPSILGSVSIDGYLMASDVYNDLYHTKDGVTNHSGLSDDLNPISGNPGLAKKRMGAISGMVEKAIKELIANRNKPRPFESQQEYLDEMEALGVRPDTMGGHQGRNARKRYDEKLSGIQDRLMASGGVPAMFPEMANLDQFNQQHTEVDGAPLPPRPFDPDIYSGLREDLSNDKASSDFIKQIGLNMSDDPNAKSNVITFQESQQLVGAWHEMMDRVAIMSAMQMEQGIDPQTVTANMLKLQRQSQAEMTQHVTRAVERVDYSPFDPQVAGVMLSSSGIESMRKTLTSQ